MKTLHAYLIRQIVAALLLTVAVFTFVLLIGNVLKEILEPLMKHQVGVGLVAEAIGLLVPFVLVFALPMGMLTATLLIFGRFSADNELTAARASGISLVSLITPILLLSVALCALSTLVNMEIAPRCRTIYTQLLFRLTAGLSAAQLLPEGRFVQDLKRENLVCVGKNRDGELEDITVYLVKDNRMIQAPRGKIEIDQTNRVINLYLFDTRGVSLNEGIVHSGDVIVQVDLNLRRQDSRRLSDMTFMELREELRNVERWLDFPLARNLTREQVRAYKEQMEKQKRGVISPIRVHLHRQIAFSFACFCFTLVGIPLGIRVHRRETTIGIAIALLLVIVYYGFVLVGAALDTRLEFAPHLIVWIPNFIFQVIGGVLLWKANRGG